MGAIILVIGKYIYDIYYWLILINIFGSWFPQFQASKIGMLVGRLVNPYLSVFRKFIPPLGMIDFSPIIAIIAYSYIGRFALEGLRQLLIMLGAL
ncbi:YggT family protein [Bacillus sp. OK048]|uniref:YggT family protein n=2 Tax=Bacillaceae TaxID=186817 RepID=UPI00088FFD2C|nr:YggT family protein [Bacillus sp. OK048]SDM62823.1 YggT family protein [Bacillus sp. OK048]